MNNKNILNKITSYQYFYYLMFLLFFLFALIVIPHIAHLIVVLPISDLGKDLFLSGKDLPSNFYLPVEYSILTIYYYFTTSMFGLVVTTKFLMENEISLPVGFAASFLPGYIITIAINRIITLIFSHLYAPIIIFIFISFLMIILFIFNINSVRDYFLSGFKLRDKNPISLIGILIFLFLLIFIFMIWRIQLHVHAFCGDSTSFITKFIADDLSNLNLSLHAPIFDFHYDEFIFNYPLIYSSRSNVFPLLYFWIISPVALVSCGCLLFSLFRYFDISRIFSILFAAFLLLGSHFLNPISYINIFDSGNPLALNYHIGRIISCIFPLMFITYFNSLNGEKENHRSKLLISFLLILFAIGIASLSFHFVLFSLGIAFVAIIYNLLKKENESKSINYMIYTLILFMVLITPFITLFFPWSENRFGGVPIIISSFLGIVFLFMLLPFQFNRNWKSVQKPLIFIVILLISSILFGNNAVIKFKGLFEKLFKVINSGYNPYLEIFSRNIIPANADIKLFSFYMEGPIFFAKSPGMFFLYFGLLISFVLSSFFLLGYSCKENKTGEEFKIRRVLFFNILLFSILFSLGIFATCYISIGVKQWYITRFIEIPFYTLIILSLISIKKYSNRYIEQILFAFLVLWTILPFVYNNRIQQWLLNLQFFIKELI